MPRVRPLAYPEGVMLELTKRLVAAANGDGPVLVASLLEPGPRSTLSPGARLVVEPSGGLLGTLGDPEIDALVASHAQTALRQEAAVTLYVAGEVAGESLTERRVEGATSVYVEVVGARPVFLVVGAGHIGRYLARMASLLEFEVAVLDDRADFADPALLPEADHVICDEFEPALDAFPINARTHIVMVTRGHRQDEQSLRRCLGRGAAYIGMIGSRRRTATVLEHLRDEGFGAAELARIRTPIGLDIGAETPAEIALSIMGEVTMLRRGGTGAPMYHRPAHLRESQP